MLCGTAFIGAHAALYGHWIVDDAAITFAYARDVGGGFGPVLQPGQPPVEGYSNPAWLLLLVAGRLLGVFDHGAIFGIPDYVLFPKALALLCCAGILALTYRAAARITRRPWLVTLMAGAGLAAIPSFVIWSFSGLENPLYALTVVALAVTIFLAVLDGRLLGPRTAIIAGLLVALAALTRPDGLIYLAAYPTVVLIQLTRARLWVSARAIGLSMLAFAVPFGGYLAWRLAEFGRLTPMTALAKSQTVPSLSDLTRAGELARYAGVLAVLGLVLVLGLALAGSPSTRTGLIALLVPLVLAILAYAVLRPDWMGQLRFATPVWALGVIAFALAGSQVAARWSVTIRVVLAVVLVAALVPSASSWATDARKFRREPDVPVCLVADRFGRTVNGYADILGLEKGTLLLPDIGGAALASRLTVVDLAGLAEARIARYWKDNDLPGLLNYLFDELRPSIVHSHSNYTAASGIIFDPRLDRDYYVVYQYPGDRLSADWVRKSLVSSPEQLDTLRAYAAATVPRVEAERHAAPRAHCGARLAP